MLSSVLIEQLFCTKFCYNIHIFVAILLSGNDSGSLQDAQLE